MTDIAKRVPKEDLKNLSPTQQENLVATWLLNGEKRDGEYMSGIELAKQLGFTPNGYFTKFIPMKTKIKDDLRLTVDGNYAYEAFFDWTTDQFLVLKDEQKNIDGDTDFAKEEIVKVLEKPMEELNERDHVALKQFTKLWIALKGHKIDSIKALHSILEGFSKATKSPVINATQVNVHNYRDKVKEDYIDGIYD